jgi:hypothetical protein
MDTLPRLSTDLVEALRAMYPPRCIRPGETPEEAHRYAGKVDLVAYLCRLAEEASGESVLKAQMGASNV